jgi:hypothetical protein
MAGADGIKKMEVEREPGRGECTREWKEDETQMVTYVPVEEVRGGVAHKTAQRIAESQREPKHNKAPRRDQSRSKDGRLAISELSKYSPDVDEHHSSTL